MWADAIPRPGSLFLVGDPKQAIYRFRGAHVAAYAAVRDALVARSPNSLIQITANFRSAPEILEHVNTCFATPLGQGGQPGYVALSPTLENHESRIPCAAKITVELPPDSSAPQLRDAEAEAVADLCGRLVGAIDVRRPDGSRTPLKLGDIALLAPTGTELWRYERALEQQGLGVASQAGKSLMRRQETQDVLALLRTLADRSDTLAFGALMRGPLVGLTEARLLAITGKLPWEDEETPSRFTVDTDPALVEDVEARSVLVTLQALRRRAATATPAALLAEAIERLDLRVALALRTGDRGGRAIANLDALIAMARPYRVRGLAAFVADLTIEWQDRRPATEGRIDESEDAVSLVTIHSAKGLEWPVVIPINTATLLRGPEQFVHRQSDDTLHWILGDLTPPHLIDAQADEALSAARERERLWYVAVTRARDLLILPDLTGAGPRSWSRVVDLGMSRLPELDIATLPRRPRTRRAASVNAQTREVFAAEADAVEAAAPPVSWRRPSEHDADRAPAQETAQADAGEDLFEAPRPVGAGRIRGILLHKLLEELLTGELVHDVAAAELRATELVPQLIALEAEDGIAPDPRECAATALRARTLPGIADLWPHLVPEVPIYASEPDGTLFAGRADAICFTDGRPHVVLDWKSDLEPSAAERAGYVSQLADYVRAFGATRGALVYLTRGEVVWLDATGAPPPA
ncbi:ATP-dependent DNA helicase PcrA [compost metagenome]